jgi:hypothetical protein
MLPEPPRASTADHSRWLKSCACKTLASFRRTKTSELRVIDAERRRTFIHSGPGPAGWRTIVERSPEEALTLPALPGFLVQLGSI